MKRARVCARLSSLQCSLSCLRAHEWGVCELRERTCADELEVTKLVSRDGGEYFCGGDDAMVYWERLVLFLVFFLACSFSHTHKHQCRRRESSLSLSLFSGDALETFADDEEDHEA